jgi:hypothetical protein
MNGVRVVVFSVAFALFAVSRPALAHHGMEMYDLQARITVKGAVTQFDYANPHVLLYLDAKDRAGKVKKWIAEAGSPNMMSRGGWNKNSVKPGEEVTLIGQPARNGSATMRLVKVVLANGQELDPNKGFK